jgi:Major capsid protein Gp23
MNINAKFLNEAKELEGRWKKTGLLDGIEDRTVRANTAVLLENQRLINESSTDTGDVAQFKRISIPLVRRVYPQLIANKIVSVQPLLGPTGLVYYLRFRYGSDKGGVRGASNKVGFPGDDANSLQQLADGTANLDVFYSHQFVQNEVHANVSGNVVSATLEHVPVVAGTVTGTIYDGAVVVQTFVVPANSSNLSLTSVDVGGGAYVTAGTLSLADGALALTWTGSSGGSKVVISYEYNMENNPDMPEINLTIESQEIAAKTRKLKAVWSYEAQQDLRSQHNLDAEAELTAVLAQEINLEIDREVLGDLRNNAGTVSAWDFNTALGDTIKEKYESLYVKVVEVSNVIHRKTLRGGANFIVTSPEVASVFETATAGFAPAPSETFTSSLGIQYVGTVNNRWRLYKDPLFPTGQLLMGYKGDSYMDSGYFYCPYVPLTQTPVVLDPDSFSPRKGLLTRYGKKLLREGAKFYARLNIANFIV